MKIRSLLPLLALLLPCALGLAMTAPAPAAPADEGNELHEHMEVIEEALGKLRRSLRDEQRNEESLAHIAVLQKETLACKLLVPEVVEELAEPQRSEEKTAYRRMMVDMLASQLELEAALLDGDADAAKKAFRKLRNMEDPGHERFTAEEE